MSKVRVLLADDHQAILARVRRELDEEFFEIVGTARNGQEAVDAVSRFDPDVLVIDISMPVLNGLETALRLRATCCRTKVVFLTIHDDPDFIAAAFSAGASGYVTKDRLSLDLVLAIREALLGNKFTSETLKK
jgi:DNA-binding NarL/FixJ family response regulator